jgi:hypothetical protein
MPALACFSKRSAPFEQLARTALEMSRCGNAENERAFHRPRVSEALRAGIGVGCPSVGGQR